MISFIIPVYNAKDYIERCLTSIVSQTGLFEYEVLVIDDGSKDIIESQEFFDRIKDLMSKIGHVKQRLD